MASVASGRPFSVTAAQAAGVRKLVVVLPLTVVVPHETVVTVAELGVKKPFVPEGPPTCGSGRK